MQADLKELTQIFSELGARDPEGWAGSQLRYGIPQLHRFLFLKRAWDEVIKEDDDAWIDAYIQRSHERPDEPFAAIGHALERMLDGNVDRADIVDLVRGMQAQFLFSLCYLIENPDLPSEVEDVAGALGWSLVATDADDEPTAQVIGGLHESVLETDPTGREMRPR